MKAFAAIAVVVSLTACTETGFHRVPTPGPEPPNTTVVIEGTYCSSDPEELVFPVKILMVLDDSGSMGGSDPNFDRVAAAQNLVDELIDTPDVFFGVEQFQGGNSVVMTQPVFTRDMAVLGPALANGAHGPNGNTPYVGALSTAVTAISTDIQQNPESAKRTRYVVIFLSDGVPTDDDPPYSLIAGTVAQLKGLENGNPPAGDVTLHTAYLQDGGPNQTAISLLNGMAIAGEGQFRNFVSGDSIDFKDFDITAISRDYRTYFPILATNMNTRLELTNGPQADSDMDGLADWEEINELGTDPGRRDTDGDGCSDVVESRYAGWDPLTHGALTDPIHCACSDEQRVADVDGDGLSDCEEQWLSMDPLVPDSDVNADGNAAPDNMIDPLEVIWNLGRTKWDANEDYDVDGVSNLVELTTHMDPNRNDNDIREDFSYNYEWVNQMTSNPRCSEFRVSNIHTVGTVAADGRPAQENVLFLYFVEAPQDDPFGESTVRRVTKTVRYTGSAPEPNYIYIEPEEFTIIGK